MATTASLRRLLDATSLSAALVDGRVLVTVHAPDRVGLLAAIAAWFEDRGANVEACHASHDEDGRAHDVFVVAGAVDADELAAALGGQPTRLVRTGLWPLTAGVHLARSTLVWPWTLTTKVARGMAGLLGPAGAGTDSDDRVAGG